MGLAAACPSFLLGTPSVLNPRELALSTTVLTHRAPVPVRVFRGFFTILVDRRANEMGWCNIL